MNDVQARKWMEKAGHDLKIGKDELRTDDPVTDMVCYHMQQCAEKALKAYLVLNNTEVPRTHNLAVILQLCAGLNPAFSMLMDEGVDRLTDYAVEMRYPDDYTMPDTATTQWAVQTADRVLLFVSGYIK